MSAVNIGLAHTFGSLGVSIFPCRESGERSKSPYIPNGFHDASANIATLRHWATMYPTAIYGLPCSPNGLFVLDADRHGKGDGVATVMEIFGHYGFGWQSVPAVRTPRDGLHLIFKKPAGIGKTKGKIADAVDVRDNGYIIAPGAMLPDGRCYELLNGTIGELAAAIAARSLPTMPDWLVAMALQPNVAPKAFKAPVTVGGVTNQLGGLIQTVITAPPGNRNLILFWAACRVGGMVNQGIIPSEAATALLVEAGQQAGLSSREAYTTAISGIRQGQTETGDGR